MRSRSKSRFDGAAFQAIAALGYELGFRSVCEPECVTAHNGSGLILARSRPDRGGDRPSIVARILFFRALSKLHLILIPGRDNKNLFMP